MEVGDEKWKSSGREAEEEADEGSKEDGSGR